MGKRADALSSDECRRRMKAWLLEGQAIPPGPAARQLHMDIMPRLINPLPDEGTMDALAEASAPPTTLGLHFTTDSMPRCVGGCLVAEAWPRIRSLTMASSFELYFGCPSPHAPFVLIP
eukprot:15364053-Alexandrium_andersonii.AAC.1